ncbi:MAG: MFS transporter [Candidatus Lokiarchaeota archaeon]|nr:MFS transporter [Candidatus Lokiarchaeota archaeon]
MTEPQKIKYSETVTTKRIVLFTLSGVSTGFLFAMWGQIQYYAANVLLIPQLLIALIYLIYSIVEAINDPVIGYLADKSKRFTSRYGKRYPWIMIGLIGGPIILVFSFIPISSSVPILVIWLIFTMILHDTFMTSVEINDNALFPDLFRESSHRGKVLWIGAILGGIITIVASVLIPNLIDGIGYLGAVIIVVIIAYVFVIPYNFGIREPEEMKNFRAELDATERGTSPIKEILKRVFKDKNWMGIVIAGFCWAVGGACFLWGLNFFVVDSLGLEIADTAIPLLMVNLVGFGLAPLWVYISFSIGNKKAFIVGMTLNIIGFFLLFFVTNLTSLIFAFTFQGIGFSATSGVIYGLLRAEGIDNATVNSGKREEGSYTSVWKFFTAFSYFFQTLIFAIVSGITGYDADLGTGNSNFAKTGLIFQMSIIPMIIFIIGTIAFALMYKISKEQAADNKVKVIEMEL